MNALAEKYGDKVAILGFPCNQFGHQTNEGNDEFLNTLKYVRPGNNFEPAPSITLFEKTDVNGENAHPLFKWLKTEMMIPTGGMEDTSWLSVETTCWTSTARDWLPADSETACFEMNPGL